MATLGNIALALAFAAGLFTAMMGARGGATRRLRDAELARIGFIVTCGAVFVASAALLYGFVTHDFSLRYVQGRSDLRMPMQYVVAAFWGGQEGSLLFWTSVVAAFGAAASAVNHGRLPTVMPFFHAVLGGVLTGLTYILVFVSSPFEQYQVMDPPVDGTGLNPLLQNPLMVIHPPCLLAGFATFAVPFAFGMAALLARDNSNEWLRATRRWTLVSWLLLSVGNILGGMWAYQELGWGGYWAWDPVENAALIPWFMASAYLHSVIIQEQRGMFRKWNAVLVALTFFLTVLGTWMTRSGLIQSVHTFAESEVGNYFLGLVVLSALFSAYVVATRWRGLTSEHYIDSPMSREGAFLMNNWILVGTGFVVLWGTLFPKFKELATGQAVAIGPTWFNKFTAPLGLVLLALMILGTLLPWRQVTVRAMKRNFTFPTVATLAVMPPLLFAYYLFRVKPLGIDAFGFGAGLAIVGATLIVYNVMTIGMEVVRGASARSRTTGDGPFGGLVDLFVRHRRRYGGYVVHLGVVMIFLAFCGNAVKVDHDVTLRVGEATRFGDYEVRFDALRTQQDLDKRQTIGDMTLTRNGRFVATLHPARYDYNDAATIRVGRPDPMKITSEIYIRSTPVEDVYVAMLQTNEAGTAGAFKLVVLPFTWWFWFGGVVLVAGTLICLWPERDPLLGAAWRVRAARAFEVAAAVALTLAPVAVFVTPMEAWAQSAGGGAAAAAEADPEHEHRPAAAAPTRGPGAAAQPAGDVVLDRAQLALVNGVFDQIMTTCEGCVGKTLSTASPSCYPSNQDKARIRQLASEGLDRDAILAVFVAERGESALAIPPDSTVNRLAWLVPALAMLFGVAIISTLVRRWSRPRVAAASAGPVGAASDAGYDAWIERELEARG